MSANVKVGANTSSFQKQMSDMTRQLKVLSSQYNLSATQAKLFGKAQDQLKAKQTELTSKIKIQNSMVEAQQKVMSKLTGDLDKQKLKRNELNKKIEETSKKYQEVSKTTGKNSEESKKLKDELTKLKESYSQNEKAIDSTNKKLDNSQIKMNNTKKSIVENEKALQEVNKKIKNVNLDNVSGKLNKVSKATGSIANVLKPFAMLIGAAGIAASKFSMDFGDGMAKVSTLADTSKVSLDDLRKGVIKLSNDTGESAKDMTEGLYQALSASVDTGDAINFMGTATKATIAGFTDTATAVDGLTTVLNSYGMQASEADKIANQMLITQNLGKTTFGQLAQSMGQVTPISSQLNISTKELFSSLASTTAQGLETSESVTALKASMSNIIKPSKEASKAAQALGIDFSVSHLKAKGWMPFLQEVKEKLENASPEFKALCDDISKLSNRMYELEKAGKKNTAEYKNGKKELKLMQKDLETLAQASDSPISAMATMFGSVKGLNSILMLTSDNGMRIYNKTMEQMNTNTGALDDAYNKMASTTQFKFKQALNQGKNALISFGDVLAPFISIASQGIGGIAKAFNGLSEGQKKVTVGIGAFVLGFTGAFFGISKFTGAMSEAITNYKKIKNVMDKWKIATKLQTAAQTALNFVMNMNPIGWWIIGITALVAAFVYFWKTSEGFRNFWIGLWNGIKNITKICINAVLGFFKGIVNFIKNDWKQILLFLVNPFAGAFALLYKHCSGFRNFINNLVNSIINFFKNIPKNISIIFNNVVITLKRWGNNVWQFFTQTIPNWMDSIGKWFSELPRKIGIEVGRALGAICKWGISVWNFFTTTIPNWIDSIGQWFSQLPGRIWTWLTNAINNFMDWGMQMQQRAYQYGYQIITNFINWVSQLPGRFWNWLTNAINNFMNWGMQVQQKAYETGANLINNFINWVSQLPGRFWNWLVQAFNSLVSWGRDLINTGKDTAINLANSIIDGIKSLPGKMLDIGRYIVEGLWQGIINAKNWLLNQIGKFASGVVEGFKQSMGIHSPARKMIPIGDFTIQGVDVGMNKAMPQLLNNVKDKMLNLTSKMKATINTEMPNIGADIENNFSLKTNISKDDLNNINSRLNTKTNNQVIVLVENNIILDGEVIGTKTYKKIAKKMQSEENSYKVTQGKRGYKFA